MGSRSPTIARRWRTQGLILAAAALAACRCPVGPPDAGALALEALGPAAVQSFCRCLFAQDAGGA
ncbi:MAG: hypothetical protein ACYCWW_19575 [Deltaproteobacteria bacterium]